MDVTFVVDGDFLLVSFHFLANARAKAEAVRKFVPSWSAANKYLVYDKDAKGIYCKPTSVAPHSNNTHCCVLIVGREAPEIFFWPGECMALIQLTTSLGGCQRLPHASLEQQTIHSSNIEC